MTYEFAEASQPWVTWTYFRPDWWTRIFGKSQVKALCCICGHREVVTVKIPRFGRVPEPAGGRHPVRVKFCDQHRHPLQQRAPETWAMPLHNLNAISGDDAMGIFQDVAAKAVRDANRAGDV